MKALFVIDYQNYFINGNDAAKAIMPALVRKIRQYEYEDIFYTLDTHDAATYGSTFEEKIFPPHCIRGTEGHLMPPQIANLLKRFHATEVEKSTFCYTNWREILMCHYDSIEIVGLATDICVLNNVLLLRSLYPYTRIVVDSKCCAGTSPKKHEAALEILRTNCIEVV